MPPTRWPLPSATCTQLLPWRGKQVLICNW
jgi:hypothetical protein